MNPCEVIVHAQKKKKTKRENENASLSTMQTLTICHIITGFLLLSNELIIFFLHHLKSTISIWTVVIQIVVFYVFLHFCDGDLTINQKKKKNK